jgi:hypothetical protein
MHNLIIGYVNAKKPCKQRAFCPYADDGVRHDPNRRVSSVVTRAHRWWPSAPSQRAEMLDLSTKTHLDISDCVSLRR